MNILIASDCHFEFHRDGGRSFVDGLADADVFVCAGDLASASHLATALDLCCDRYRQMVFVCGNHEFYGSSFARVRGILCKAQERHRTLHVLDNTTCEIEGRRFVGTTMWFRKQPDNVYYHNMMGDFSEISCASTIIYEENDRAIAFLEKEVGHEDIVVTHHLPAEKSVSARFRTSSLNRFFLCDVEALIHDRQPLLWCHGHTHDSKAYKIGATQILCNPFGYAGHEVNREFNPGLLVSV